MAHEIHASIVLCIEDDDPKEWTSALSVVAAQWTQFLAAVEPLRGVAAFSVTETRASGGNGARPRRRRRKQGEGHTEAEHLAAMS